MAREMINVENGKVELNGSGMNLLTDLSCAVSAVYESFVEIGIPADLAKRHIERAVAVGFMKGTKKQVSDIMGGVLNDLYEILGEILGKAGNDNGSK